VPRSALPNPNDFEELSRFPVEIIVWRPARETMARSRNPVFDTAAGLSPERILTVDILHCFYLGVLLNFAKYLLWTLIRQGVWGRHPTTDETVAAAVIAIRLELKAWYTKRHREKPDEGLTRITKFRKQTIGEAGDPKLRTKGAETWGFLLFLLDVLDRRGAILGDSAIHLKCAGRALESLILLWNRANVRLTDNEIEASFEHWNVFLRSTDLVDDLKIPKRHLGAHMLNKLRWFGNHRNYATWQDESDNKKPEAACQRVSQATFEPFVLLRMRQILPRSDGRKRKASGA